MEPTLRKGKLAPEEARVLLKRQRRGRGTEGGTLPVYVSGDHNEALESLHAAIRVGEVAFSGLAMLHIDSHPDLMVPPRMPADLVFKPRELHYELARSETGIAEFILPAVYAGHLERITWLRPPWADQLPDGLWDFEVGKAPGSDFDEVVTEDGEIVRGGPLRVSWTAPYYADEGLSCSVSEMENVKSMQLFVADENACTPDAIEGVFGTRPWILDICLDYFSVNNPFYVDLQDKLGDEAADLCTQVYAGPQLLWRQLEMARQTRFTTANMSLHAEKKTVANHSNIEAKQGVVKEDQVASTNLTLELVDEGKAQMSETRPTYVDDDQELKLRHDIAKKEHEGVIAVVLRVPDDAEALEKLKDCFDPRNASTDSSVDAFATLAKKLDEEKRDLVSSCGPNLDLPHHRSTDDQIERVFQHLVDLLTSIPVTPSIVTIAKSSSDMLDYTPVDQVETLLKKTLEVLQRVYPQFTLEVTNVDEDEDEESV